MNDPVLSLIVKLHDDLKSDVRSEISLLRQEVHKWRDESAQTQKVTWKLSGGIAVLVFLLEGVIKIAETYFH